MSAISVGDVPISAVEPPATASHPASAASATAVAASAPVRPAKPAIGEDFRARRRRGRPIAEVYRAGQSPIDQLFIYWNDTILEWLLL